MVIAFPLSTKLGATTTGTADEGCVCRETTSEPCRAPWHMPAPANEGEPARNRLDRRGEKAIERRGRAGG